MSIDKHQDQEEPVFNDFYEFDNYDNFDYFDFHSEDDYLGFSEHNLTFQHYQDEQKVENDSPVSSQVSNENQEERVFSLSMVKNQEENDLLQRVTINQTKDVPKKTKKPKTKVKLSKSAEQFKKKLYKILSNGEKNIVRKEFVFLYHSLICERIPNLRDANREEYRSIGNYFNSFAPQQNIILQALRELKKTSIPEFNYIYRVPASIQQV